MPHDWLIGLNDNGWTNNELRLVWLEKVFEKHTASCTIGRYQLLILDGHASHDSAKFDFVCKKPLDYPPIYAFSFIL